MQIEMYIYVLVHWRGRDGQDIMDSLHKSSVEENFLSLVINRLSLDLLNRLATGLQWGPLLYLLQNSSVL